MEDRLGALNREGFESRNLRCGFDVDASAWESLARRLMRRGLLRFRRAVGRPDLGPRVSLTPRGGHVWELERTPDWSRFCEASSRPERANGLWVVRVRSPRSDVAEAFLNVANACALYSADFTRLERRQVRARLVPWKARGAVFELRAPLVEPQDGSLRVVDWTAYESHRTWWRCITELIKVK